MVWVDIILLLCYYILIYVNIIHFVKDEIWIDEDKEKLKEKLIMGKTDKEKSERKMDGITGDRSIKIPGGPILSHMFKVKTTTRNNAIFLNI